MPSNKLKSNLNKSLLILLLLIFTSCGSFNSSSLLSADGIYSNENKSETKNISSKYYENYFKEKALELGDDFVFSDSIKSSSDFITSNQINYSTNNAAWGQIPDTKDYVIDYYSYRNRYFGYSYYSQMYSPYGYGYGYPFYSYFAMRNWYRYGWGIGYYPFYLDYYPYGWWGRTMPFGYRNRYSSYGAYGNNVYDNYINRDYNNVSYNDGRRGSSSDAVIYGNGKSTSANGNSKNNNSSVQMTYYNVGRAATVQDDNNIGNNDGDSRIRTYKEFVKNNNTNSVTRNRTYTRPEMGVGLSATSRTSTNSSNGNDQRRYYNNPNNVKGRKTMQYDWGLGGRAARSNSNGSQARSYGNSSSNSTSGGTRSYSSPSTTSGNYSRPSSPPSSNTSRSSSSGGSSSSVGSSSRGSR